jgi:hypothetical protein
MPLAMQIVGLKSLNINRSNLIVFRNSYFTEQKLMFKVPVGVESDSETVELLTIFVSLSGVVIVLIVILTRKVKTYKIKED